LIMTTKGSRALSSANSWVVNTRRDKAAAILPYYQISPL
jgi:hypothetical protein